MHPNRVMILRGGRWRNRPAEDLRTSPTLEQTGSRSFKRRERFRRGLHRAGAFRCREQPRPVVKDGLTFLTRLGLSVPRCSFCLALGDLGEALITVARCDEPDSDV